MASSVTISYGYTVNMGDFESLRVDIGVTDSVRESENVKQATERVSEFVENKLVEKVNQVRTELAKGK